MRHPLALPPTPRERVAHVASSMGYGIAMAGIVIAGVTVLALLGIIDHEVTVIDTIGATVVSGLIFGLFFLPGGDDY